MKSHSISIIIFATIVLAACHHDDTEKHSSAPQSAHIECYEGGGYAGGDNHVYNGDTEPGRPLSVDSSGVDFQEAKTGRHIHIYGGACRIEYQDQ